MTRKHTGNWMEPQSCCSRRRTTSRSMIGILNQLLLLEGEKQERACIFCYSRRSPCFTTAPFPFYVACTLLFLFLLDFFSSSVTISRERRRRRQKCFPAPRLSRVPSFRAAGQNAREDARREDGLSSRTRRKIRGRKNARRREDGR